MIAILFEIEYLAWCPLVGLALVIAFCIHFFGILVHAVVAVCGNYPMPLDDRYWFGQVNNRLLVAEMVCALILFFI
jgi:hypothetical protein